jgi:CheY-like chemotaxis protein
VREPVEVREPELDERAHALLEARLACHLERLEEALAGLLGGDTLLEPVVAGHEELLDPLPRLGLVHPRTLPRDVPPVRVLIADDQRLFAEALEAILGADDRIEVVGRAGNGAEAVELVREREPDVVLMDLSMPVLDGFEATRSIVSEADPPAVLVLTGSDSAADVARARDSGASGYMTKDHIASELVAAILHAVGA